MIKDSYSLEIKFPTDEDYNEYDAEFNGFSLTEKMHSSLKAVDNMCNVSLTHNAVLENKLRGLNEDGAMCRVRKNGKLIFTGYIRKGFAIRNTGRVQSTSITIVSPSFFLKRSILDYIRLLNVQVCTDENSIIYKLFMDAGFTARDLDLLPKINTVLPYFVVNPGTKTYWDLLNTLFFEYGYILEFNADGKPCAYAYSQADINPEHSFTTGNNGNIHGALTQKITEETYQKINVTWTSTKTLQNVNIFSDTQNATISDKCVIEVNPQEYYGQSAAGSEGLYMQYSCQDYDLLYAYDVSLDIVKQSDLILEEFTDYGKKAFLKLFNQNSTFKRTINKLDVNGTAIVIDAVNASKISNSDGKFAKSLNYTSNFIFDKSNADALCSRLASYYKFADYTYELSSYNDYAAGSYVTVSDPETGSVVCRILQKKTDELTGLINYTLEGVAEYSPIATATQTESNTKNNGNVVALVQKVVPEVEHLIDVSNRYVFDVSPEALSVSCDSEGKLINASDLLFTADLFYGAEKLNNVTYAATVDGASVGSWSGNKLTVSTDIITRDVTAIEFKATYGDIIRTVNVIITKLYAGKDASWEQYGLMLSDDLVKVIDGAAYPPVIDVHKVKTTATETNAPTDYGHVEAVVNDAERITVDEWQPDKFGQFDELYKYSLKRQPFFLKVDGKALCTNSKKVMISYYREKE